MCYDWLCGVAGGGKVYEPELVFKKKGRGCTDLLGLAIYIASWIAIIVIISTAGGKGGNPNKIIHGVDWEGKICGKDGGVIDRPYVAWPYVPLASDVATNQPNLDDFINVRVCLQSCAETESNSTYMMRNYKSREFIYYCVPDSSTLSAAGDDLAKNLDDASNRSEREIASLFTVWPALLASAGIALLLTFAYNFLTRYIAGFIVWLALILLTVGGFLTSYVLLKTAGDVNSETPSIRNRAKLMRGFGWTVAVLTIIGLIVFFAIRKRMYIAVETIKEAARAVDDMKFLTLWPFFPMFFALGYITFFVATAMFIISVTSSHSTPLPSFMYDNPSTKQVQCAQNDCIWNNAAIFKGNYTDLSWDTSMKHSFVYAFFHLLWSTQFIIYFNYIVIAGAIASWYFSHRNDEGKKIRGDGDGELSYTPVCGAIWRVIRYNLGTVAIAALIIAVIKFIRACVVFIEKKLQAKGEPNRLQRCLFCMIHCCLKCVECCCDKINKNLLIWNAVYGHNFASSACSSFAIIWANMGRIGALNLVGELIMLVGKLVVALLTTGLAGLIIYAQYRNQIESPTLALAICFIIGYVVASMFMLIFEVAIDAVFLCFLIDEKLNAGQGKMFASPGLKEIVEKHAETSKEIAQEHNAQLAQRQSFYKKGGMTEAGANYA